MALPAAFALCAITLGAASKPLPAVHIAIAAAPLASGASGASMGSAESGCPAGTLPDGDICVHLPSDEEGEEPEAPAFANAHHTRRGSWFVYDQIPRRPERPSDYDLYRYPIPCASPHCVISGYDLDRPDEAQRRGFRLHAVGHGAVDLPQAKGTPIKMIALDHQQGDADVVYVGAYFGMTVITRHTLREGGRLRDYLLLFGHLDAPAPGLAAGATLEDGDLVGSVGDTGSPELVHLHLEARRVRDGVDVNKVASQGPGRMTQDDVSVVCDPRNVLPLR